MTQYSYTKSPCAVDRLQQEIKQSTIVTALDHISLLGTDLEIYFKADLTTADKSTLDTLVANHSGQPLPDNTVTPVSVSSIPPFAAKTLGTKSLYKRVVGQQYTLTQGDNTLTYTETFPWVKFMALEVVNGEVGDYCSLYILDTATGTYSGYPNAQLNQFGFNANIAKDFYQHKSEFDADVYQGLQIKIVYHSVSAKTIGINFVMNEVK